MLTRVKVVWFFLHAIKPFSVHNITQKHQKLCCLTRKCRHHKVGKLCSTSTKTIFSLTLTLRSVVLVRVRKRSIQDAFQVAPLLLRAKEKACAKKKKRFFFISIAEFLRNC